MRLTSTRPAPWVRAVVAVAFVPFGQACSVMQVVFPHQVGETAASVETGLSPVFTADVAASVASRVVIEPPVIEMSSLVVGCSDSAEMIVESTGNAPAVIEAIDVYGDVGQLDIESEAREAVLQPGETLSLRVHHTPRFPSFFETQVRVRLSTGEVVTGHVSAEAVGTRERVDALSAPPSPVDVVFVFDGDPRTMAARGALVDQIAYLVAAMFEETTDFTVSAILPSSPCAVGSVSSEVPSAMFDQARELFDEVAQYRSSAAVDIDLVAHTREAFALTGERACNSGMLRPGARAHVVFFAASTNKSPLTAAQQVQDLSVMAPEPELLRITAMVGDGYGCGADPGAYVDLAALTGGAAYTYCGIGTNEMVWLARNSLPPLVVPLSAVPDSAQRITVSVDGVVAAREAWSYDSDAVAVTIPGGVTAGDPVDVRYLASCDE
jgi:hypothetical protein